MRSLPMQNVPSKSELVSSTFYGLNRNLKIADGEAEDMLNITNEYYPLLSPRRKRVLTNFGGGEIGGILAKEKLTYLKDGYLWYDGGKTELYVGSGDKKLLSFGAYILIFPDCAYYNIADDAGADYGFFNRSISATAPLLYNCDASGNKISVAISVDNIKPSNPEDGDAWIEKQLTEDGILELTMWKYDKSFEEWRKQRDTYVAIEANNIGGKDKAFKIEGLGEAESQSDPEEIAIESIKALNGKHTAVYVEENKVVIEGIIFADEWQQTASASQIVRDETITLKATAPQMDYIIEGNNRLWGCRYGEHEGEIINEIYASKLGDFTDWESYQGIASDSYTASVGSDGAWTGAINYNGYPLFFKENVLHKVYISPTGAHEIKQIPCSGVERWSEGSLAIVNGVLLYKSPNGIVEYDGSSFTKISDKLGHAKYSYGVAGAFDNKYYISMRNEDINDYELFVYDTAKDLWCKEDNLCASGFAALNDCLYCVSGGEMYDLISDVKDLAGDPVEWEWQTGMMGYEYTGKKYISRFNIRMQLPKDSEIRIYIEYDTSGKWELKGKLKGKGTKTFLLPIIPRRCDHFKIKLVGKGDAKIYSFSRIFEGGSDE